LNALNADDGFLFLRTDNKREASDISGFQTNPRLIFKLEISSPCLVGADSFFDFCVASRDDGQIDRAGLPDHFCIAILVFLKALEWKNFGVFYGQFGIYFMATLVYFMATLVYFMATLVYLWPLWYKYFMATLVCIRILWPLW
jgi:hypothetical protein